MDYAALPTQGETLTAVPQKTNVWLHRLGSMLGMAGVLFVCLRLYEFQGQIGFQNISAPGYAAAAGLALVYGAANLLLALAWHNLLSALKSPVPIRWAVWAYAVSQLAKYVPGNIFQFAGRQAIGLAAGFPGWPLAKSTAWELALISLCGAVFGILVLPLLPVAISSSVAALLFSAATIALILATRTLWDSRAAGAVLCYLIFLALSGLVFTGALAIADHGITGVGNILPALVGAYVIAWLAGLLTPGAPAGLGVREAVLLILLSGLATDPVILLAVVVGRAITVSGDLMFYAAGRLLPFNASFDK
jgi:hypothetical protein